MGYCKDCRNGEDYKGGIYCNYYKQVYDLYDSCAGHFIDRNTNSGCYLTSACVEALNLADDCDELTKLRLFRDNYLVLTEEGRRDIIDYYNHAPLVVEAINQLPDKIRIYEQIYHELVLKCVGLIDNGELFQAYTLYKNYVLYLKSRYIYRKQV